MWCTDRSRYLPGQAVVGIEWFVEGANVGSGKAGSSAWLWTPEGWFDWGTMNLTVSMRILLQTQDGTGGPLITKELVLHNWPRAVFTIATPFALVAMALRRRYVVGVKSR